MFPCSSALFCYYFLYNYGILLLEALLISSRFDIHGLNAFSGGLVPKRSGSASLNLRDLKPWFKVHSKFNNKHIYIIKTFKWIIGLDLLLYQIINCSNIASHKVIALPSIASAIVVALRCDSNKFTFSLCYYL